MNKADEKLLLQLSDRMDVVEEQLNDIIKRLDYLEFKQRGNSWKHLEPTGPLLNRREE